MDGKQSLNSMHISSLPFYYKSHKENDNGGKPHVVPFNLEFDLGLNLVKQVSTPELEDLLEEVYKEGSLVDGSISSESGLHYVNPILDFIISGCQLQPNAKVLEIGFGEGIFLKRLKDLGYKYLYGIEPGNHKRCEGLEGINLVSDFYPSSHLMEKVDLIFHSLVLEHIKNPVDFLIAQKEQLNEGGKIVVVVPNEEPFLQQGDCSSFIHEHFNFFTSVSLKNVALSAGLHVEKMTVIDGLLATILTTESISKAVKIEDGFDFNDFLKSVEKQVAKTNSFVEAFPDRSDLAIYVPGRALNLMYLVGNSDSRLVDDNSEIHHKYLPFFKRPVEPFDSLLQNPPKTILIFSRTFYNAIKDKCRKHSQLENCRILSVDDLLIFDA